MRQKCNGLVVELISSKHLLLGLVWHCRHESVLLRLDPRFNLLTICGRAALAIGPGALAQQQLRQLGDGRRDCSRLIRWSSLGPRGRRLKLDLQGIRKALEVACKCLRSMGMTFRYGI